MEVGRNAPCPCGALKPGGKPLKYKRCCWLKKKSAPTEAEILDMAQEVLERYQKNKLALEEKGIFVNYVKPVTYTNPKTKERVRAWALRNRLYHTRPEHETFHEFIIAHLQREVLGKEWWDEQIAGPQKHFLFTCFEKYDSWRIKNATETQKIDEHTWAVIPDGWAQTLVSLAFDVATLEHTQELPDHLIKRLKNRGEYQGAHYEIAVAAIFARLGCSIEFLDDTKIFTPHCEFVATHQQTGVSIAVEAKSRQRPGVKHMEGAAEQEQLLRGDVKRLLDKAMTQNPKDKPFVVFVDVNAPLTPTVPMQEKPWYKDIRNMLDPTPAPTPEKPAEYTALFFTNFSPHYNGENQSDPNEYLTVIPRYATYPLPNAVFGDMLIRSVQNYGFVPNLVEDNPEEE